MVTPAAGTVVLVPFPFSDLSQAKLRPAVVLAMWAAGIGFYAKLPAIPTAIPCAIRLEDASFAVGALRVVSYARPGGLFTADSTLMVTQVGTLKAAPFQHIIEAVVALLQTSISTITGAVFEKGVRRGARAKSLLGVLSSQSPLADPAPNQALVAPR